MFDIASPWGSILGRHHLVRELRQALQDKPTLETSRRLEKLLLKCEAQRFRALRAIEVLESVGTGEARGLLEALAKGAPGARVTEEAEASLDRLRRRVR